MIGIRDTATVTLNVNGAQAKQMMSDLETKINATKATIQQLKANMADPKDIEKARKQLRDYEKQLDEIKSATDGVNKALGNLDAATPRQLEKALRTLNKQLKDMEPGSKVWNEHVEKIKELKDRLSEIREELTPQETLWGKFKNWINDSGAAILALGLGFDQVISTLRGYVDAYAEMDAEMANVRKFTGMTAEQVSALNEEFKKFDTRTSREDLNKLAQEAGRLGKTSSEDVLGFVRAADQINVALDDLGEGATLTLSKLTGIFGDEARYGTEQSLLKVGSVINELSQNCSASAPYLAQFAQRLGGVGAQANMTIPQIMGFAAVLDSNAQAVEASSTALSQVIVRMMQDPAKYAQVAGLEVEKFTNLLKEDTNSALILFLETLQKAGGMDVLSPMFKDMGENGSRAIAALSTLATHIDQVKAQQEAANVAFEEGTSVTQEFNVQNTTVAATLEKCKNAAHEFQVQLGEKLQPLMSHLLTTGSAMMRAMLTSIDFISRNKTGIITLTAATVAYTVALKAHSLWLDRVAIKTLLADKWTKILAATQKGLSGIWAAMKLGAAALTNAFQYFTHGLEVNYTMQQRWRTAMAAMDWKAWTAGIVAAAAAIVYLYVKMTDLLSTSKLLNQVEKEANKTVAEHLSRIKDLRNAMNDQNASYADRIKAIKELESIIPDYHAYLTREGKIIRENTSAIDKYIEAVRRQARVEAARAKLVELEKERLDIETDIEADTKGVNWERAGMAYLSNLNTGVAGGVLTYGAQTAGDYGINQVKLAANQRKMEALEELIGEERKDELSDRKKARADEVAQMQKINRDLYKSDEEYRKAVDLLVKRLRDSAGSVPEAKRNKDYNAQMWYLNQKFAGKGSADQSPAPAPEVSPVPPAPTPSPSGGAEDIFAAEKEWRQQQESMARISFGIGKMDSLKYTDEMNEIAVEFYKRQLQHTELSADQRLQIAAQYYEAVERRDKAHTSASLAEEESRYSSEVALAKQNYIDGQYSAETYHDEIERLEIEHQQRLVNLYKEGTTERAAAEAKLADLLLAQTSRRQKQQEENERKLKEIQMKYFGMTPAERQQGQDSELAALEEVYSKMKKAAEGNNAELLIIEENYQKALKAIRDKYNQAGVEGAANAASATGDKIADWLNSDGGNAVAGTISTLSSGLGSIFSGLSSVVQSEMEIQTAAINRRYDAEIERAQGNSYMVAKLEKQKEKELARTKNEANKKMFAMQVVQAIAQTATNALNAYGSAAAIPVVGHVLAPIAAAMAVAAGMIQVTAIKKQQQQAAATGYSEGGFTKPGAVDEPAGIVHAGEWVASQKLLANPVARPMIDALDRMQRTNTIGSLREEDVSRSIRANDSIARIAEDDGSVVLMVAAMARNAQAVDALVGRLNEPFVTINTVTGEYGSKRAQEDYERLMKNKSPKSK